jgi:hypothetical protein
MDSLTCLEGKVVINFYNFVICVVNFANLWLVIKQTKTALGKKQLHAWDVRFYCDTVACKGDR